MLRDRIKQSSISYSNLFARRYFTRYFIFFHLISSLRHFQGSFWILGGSCANEKIRTPITLLTQQFCYWQEETFIEWEKKTTWTVFDSTLSAKTILLNMVDKLAFRLYYLSKIQCKHPRPSFFIICWKIEKYTSGTSKSTLEVSLFLLRASIFSNRNR